MHNMEISETDNRYMRRALELASEAASEGEVPVGAVIVNGEGLIIGEGRNRREGAQDPLAHAELDAIAAAAKSLKSWRLEGCTLYVTLEPCPMCAGGIINSRIIRVVYGAADPKAGCCESIVPLLSMPFNHRPDVTAGVLAEECGDILRAFFKRLRE